MARFRDRIIIFRFRLPFQNLNIPHPMTGKSAQPLPAQHQVSLPNKEECCLPQKNATRLNENNLLALAKGWSVKNRGVFDEESMPFPEYLKKYKTASPLLVSKFASRSLQIVPAACHELTAGYPSLPLDDCGFHSLSLLLAHLAALDRRGKQLTINNQQPTINENGKGGGSRGWRCGGGMCHC